MSPLYIALVVVFVTGARHLIQIYFETKKGGENNEEKLNNPDSSSDDAGRHGV